MKKTISFIGSESLDDSLHLNIYKVLNGSRSISTSPLSATLDHKYIYDCSDDEIKERFSSRYRLLAIGRFRNEHASQTYAFMCAMMIEAKKRGIDTKEWMYEGFRR